MKINLILFGMAAGPLYGPMGLVSQTQHSDEVCIWCGRRSTVMRFFFL